MKISVESIIGSARKIQEQRPRQRGERDDGAQVRADYVSIEHRIDKRLSDIHAELRDIQHSLTKNQIIEEGIVRLREDVSRGGENIARILDETRFEGNRVLASFVGGHPDAQLLEAGLDRVRLLIRDDVSRLRSLQVEAENLGAAGTSSEGEAGEIVHSIADAINTAGIKASSVFSIESETVRRLVR